MKRPVWLLLPILFLAGCSISLTSSRVRDGGLFRSTDFGEQWEQKVFVRQEKKRVISISDVTVTRIVFSPHAEDEITLTTAANGVYVTTDGGERWQPTQFSSGNFSSFAYDPTNTAIQYVATGATVLKTADTGQHWEVIYTETRGEAITAVAVDAYDAQRLYLATQGGTILKSTNGGQDWLALTDLDDVVHTILMSPRDTRVLYAATGNRGIFLSTDGGLAWKTLEGLTKYGGAGTVNGLQILPADATDILYAATNYGLLRSPDSGTSWVPIKTLVPFGTLPLRAVAVEPQRTNILYFSVNNLIHKSEDGGATWRTIETVPTRRPVIRLAVHPSKPGVVFAGTLKQK